MDKYQQKIQQEIAKLHPEKLAEYQRDLCPKCANTIGGECMWHLIPVTYGGNKCPYFNEKDNASLLSA